MLPARYGRLRDASDAPTTGERVEPLAVLGGAAIEQILSGRLDSPVDYNQDHDEWVVLLAGSADLEVDGDAVTLQAGDWLMLPAGTPHRLIRTTPGASWLAVRDPGR